MKKLFKKLLCHPVLRHGIHKILFGFAALLVIGTPIAYLFLLNANNTQAAWFASLSSRSGFNDNWAYRKAIMKGENG